MLGESKTAKLVAIGASVGANCGRCLRYHIEEARKAGATDVEIVDAMDVGAAVRTGAGVQVEAVRRAFGYEQARVSAPCAHGGTVADSTSCCSDPTAAEQKS